MDTTLGVIAIICGVIGLLGAVLPVLPGTVISYIGMLCVSFISYSELSTLTLATWGIVAVVVIVMDYVLPGYFSKKFGGTKAGVTGATIGTIAGIFFGPLGIIFGPFVGAVVGELLAEKLTFNKALTVGFGSMMSFLVGTLFKLIAGGFMLYYIIKDVIH
jgi:uncharacterized protein YqgC (DUF456 family)